MAQNVAEVHLVLDQCGIHSLQFRNRMINNEGFVSLEEIGLLEGDSDVVDTNHYTECILIRGE